MKFLQREEITRDDGKQYLVRYIVFECSLFRVLVHRFMASDDECMHDHPWWFVSILLRGGYWECTPASYADRRLRSYQEQRRWYRPGSILWRRPPHPHRIEVAESGRTWSLVVTGPKVRPWGFWTLRDGWVAHSAYSHKQHCLTE